MYQRLLIPATDQLPCFRTVVTYASDSQLDAFLVDDLDDIVFSKSPVIRVTPTNKMLVAFGPNNASSAPWLICISPLAKPSEWAIHFFTLLTGLSDG